MASKIILKKSSVAAKAPVAGDLEFGELAINYTDSKLYFKKADGSIDAFTSAAASAPVTSVGGNIGAVTDAQLLASIKNVDGTGSGLDADFLDGLNASAFYLASNPNGYTSNTGTVTSVGATAPLVSSGGTAPSISIPAANSTTNGYMSSAYAAKLDGIAAGATNVTNNNQLTNGAGYITSAALASYLPLTGGSLTGPLNVNRRRLSFSSSYNDANHSIYNNYENIDGEGIWDGMKMNVYEGLRVRVGNASGVTPTTILALSSSSVRINTQLQVGQNTNGTATIDAYNGFAWFGRDSNTTGIRIDGSGNVHTTAALNSVGALTQNGNQVLHAGNYTSYSMPSGSSATNSVDVRAPIFYDSNDTGYYIDPSSYSRIRQLTLTQARVDSSKYPVGHYAPGEEVFAIDPTWTQDQLREYFNSNNVSWVADSTAPGGYAIQLTGAINVGGVYGSGFPYIPVETDDTFYMEVYIKNVTGSNTHYMGSMDFNHNFTNLGGNPGSFGYWVMSNNNPGTGWTKYSGYISGFGTATGQFVSGTEYWTPQALFNYSGGGTSYISGWKVLKLTKGIVGRFPNSTVNTGEAWYGRANDRNRGTYTIQLGGNSASGRQFEVVDYAWSTVMFRVDSANFSESAGSSRAPIFYDSNDTGYYIDPNSTSTSYRGRGEIFLGPNTSSQYLRLGGNGGAVDHSTVSTSNGNLHIDAKSGNNLYLAWYNGSDVMVGGGIQATIYYDRNDTSYYIDAHSTSYQRSLFLGAHDSGTSEFRFGEDSSGWYGDRWYWDSSYTLFRYSRFAGTDSLIHYHDTRDASRITYGRNIVFDNYGKGIVGTYASTRYQAVFAMGDSYKLPVDGTTTGSLYGLAWSHPNAGGTAGNLNTHGLLVLENGGFLAAVSGSIRSRDDMRSPIFYDSNNTGYYVNPDSTSYLYNLTLAGGGYFQPNNWIQFNGSYGLYWPNHYGAHLHANDLSTYTQIALRGSKNSYGGIYDQFSAVNIGMYDSGGNGGLYREANGRWYQYHNVSTNCTGFGTSSTNSAYGIYVVKGGYFDGRVDATIFYDANNTGYYADLNSGSNFNDLTSNQCYVNGWFRNNASGSGVYNQATGQHFYSDSGSYWNMGGGNINGQGIRFRDNNAGTVRGYLYYDQSNNIGFLNSGGNWRLRVVGDDYTLSEGSSMRAQLYYDSNNTGYYADLNSTTYLYYLQSATTVRADSDRRLKENITPITSALSLVRQLQGCRYTRNDLADKTKVYIGMIAQDVLPIVPEVVSGSEAGKYSLGYAELVPVLNEAVKELDEIVSKQAAIIAKLEERLSKLLDD